MLPKTLPVIAVVMMVALAGCSFIGGDSGPTESPDQQPTETTAPADTLTETQTETQTETNTQTDTSEDTPTEPSAEEFDFPAGASDDGLDGSTFFDTVRQAYAVGEYTSSLTYDFPLPDGDIIQEEVTVYQGTDWLLQDASSDNFEDFTYTDDSHEGYVLQKPVRDGQTTYRVDELAYPFPDYEDRGSPLIWILFAGTFEFQGISESDVVEGSVATYEITGLDSNSELYDRAEYTFNFDEYGGMSDATAEGELSIDSQGRIVDMEYTASVPDVSADVEYTFDPTSPDTESAPVGWTEEAWSTAFYIDSANATDNGLALNISQASRNISSASVRVDSFDGTETLEPRLDSDLQVSAGDTLYVGSVNGSDELSTSPIENAEPVAGDQVQVILLNKDRAPLYISDFALSQESE